MDLFKDDVKTLVSKLQSQFLRSELVCEVVNVIWLSKPPKGLVNSKIQKELKLGRGVAYNFGIRNSEEMEEWNAGIKLVDEWCYFEAPEKKLGLLRLFKYFKLFRKTQWMFHNNLSILSNLLF